MINIEADGNKTLRKIRAGVATLVSAALVSAGLVVGIAPASAAGDIDGSVSGVVFQDFASTGWYSEGNASAGVVRNRPVAGVTATAYDADGDVVGTGVSDDDGEYAIDVIGARSDDLRVEFSGWDALGRGFEPGFAANGTPPTGVDIEGDNNTSVQFVMLGDTSVDLSLVIPDQVVQENAPIATAIQYPGDPAAEGNFSQGLASLVAQPWSDEGSSDDDNWPFARQTLGTFEETGSIWGTAYIRDGNMMLASASLKRMAGMKEDNGDPQLGGIYRVLDVLDPDGNVTEGAGVEQWFDVSDLGVQNGAGTVDLGSIETNADRGLDLNNTPAKDIDAFTNAARAGIGGIATTVDSSTLFVTNLNDRSIYGIDIQNAYDNASFTPSQAVKIESGLLDNQQLWALSVYGERLYMGYVDTGSRPGVSAEDAGMMGYVVSTPVSALQVAVSSGSTGVVDPEWREELTFDLGYTKGSNVENWPARRTSNGAPIETCPSNGNAAGPLQDQADQLQQWNSWTDSWSWDSNGDPVNTDNPFASAVTNNGGTVGLAAECKWGTGWLHSYAQPILSGITFDIDGYMIVGLTDRTALQSGNRNYAAVTVPTTGRYWESVINGDTLIASPAALGDNGTGDCASTGQFRLECDGTVGERGPRTTSEGDPSQEATYDNGQGPLTGEFLNDRQNLGTGTTHNEVTMGSVVTYPGVDEIASTAMDPLSGINRNGLLWFDQNNGVATRGFDQVCATLDPDDPTLCDDGEVNSSTVLVPTFQKGGGLGSVALLGVASPIEIGNRVWYDADLNGRQDADEPGINGAIVELWSADENGVAEELIGERTTASVNGRAGTYYFRSDDPDIQYDSNAPDEPAFVPGSAGNPAEYVLIFKPGSTLALEGANADHAGFADMAWDDIQLTTSGVTSTATTGNYSGATGTTNDSDPVPSAVSRVASPTGSSTGQVSITVGGPGENDHTYDAGYFGVSTYEIEKTFDVPEGVVVDDDFKFTIEVDSANNFRGSDRIDATGNESTALPGDPKVTELEFTLEKDGVDGDWVAVSSQSLPYGYELTFSETGDGLDEGGTGGTVTFIPPNGDDSSTGRLVISPKTGELVPRVTVENAYGGFTLAKALADGENVPSSTTFDVTYSYALPGAEAVGPVTTTLTPGAGPIRPVTEPLPYGTSVTVCEPAPSVTGWNFDEATWTVNGDALTANDDGCVTFEIDGESQDLDFVVTNAFDRITGGFTIAKARAEGEPLPDATFSFQYKVGEDGTPVNLGPIAAGDTVDTASTIVYGSDVWVRENTPADTDNVSWDDVVWSGTPTDWTEQSAGWYSFEFLPPVDLTLTATNKAVEQYGSFQVTKTVQVSEDGGEPDVAGKTFDLEYRTSVDDGETWSDPTTKFELAADEASDTFGGLALGTLVQVREIQPANTPGVSWGTPTWTVGGDDATTVDGWTQFTITASDINETVALSVVNTATETYGSFTLQKALDGTGSALVGDKAYPVDVKIGDADAERIELAGDGTVWEGPEDLEIGTIVKVKEVTPLPEVDGVEWGTPTWAAAAGTAITIDNDGWTVFEITSDAASAALTVTNYPTQLFGGFTVAKTLTVNGDPAIVPSTTEYSVVYQIDDEDPVTLKLTAGETSALVGELPFGTVVTVGEAELPEIAGVEWGTPTWTINGASQTPDADGQVSFTIESETTVEFSVANTATQLFGQFQVEKTVTGTGADMVPDDAEFTFEYTLGDGDAQQLTATIFEASEVIANLPFGTVVSITEIGFPEIAGIEWGEQTWSLGDEEAEQPVSFTIDGTTLVSVAVENTATQIFGSFDVTKELTGDGADRVPEDASFVVEYSTDEGATWIPLDPITMSSLTVAGPDLLVGTNVLLREVAPGDGIDYAWQDPVFTVDDAEQGATASFTIAEKDQEIAVLLNNPALASNGTFTVTKAVEGFELTDPEMAELTFTVNWSGGDRSGAIELNQAGAWTGGPGELPFPVGTQITLTEAEVTGLDPNVRFDDYEWAEGPGITVSGDGQTATLTVSEGDPAALLVTNSFTELFGDFAVEKVVDGPFELNSDELKDLTFEVNYSASNDQTGVLYLNAAGEWAATGPALPTGTTVALTEVAVDQDTLAPNVQWDGYTWLDAEGVTVSEDGSTATITIGDDTTVQLQLENSFSELTGSFAVQKLVDGDFELTSPELSGLTFEVEYTASNGASGSLEMNSSNGWSAAGPDLPRGVEVTLTETPPADLPPSVEWTGYTWIAGDGISVSEDGLTATIVISDGDPVRLSVQNSFDELTGTFDVTKVVEGDFELTDPALSGLAFTVPYTASNGVDGELTLDINGGWSATPDTTFPVGTVVTLTEADVDGLPGYVQWDGYSWLAGAGYAVSEDGRTATLTITEGDVSAQLQLENEFSELLGGFTLTKSVSGDADERVPDDFEFVAEYSLDDGETWTALPAMTKAAPTVDGPSDLRLGSDVWIREIAPEPITGVGWGQPVFSGLGVVPGEGDVAASFVIDSTDTMLDVLLTNPTTPLDVGGTGEETGQFMLTKKITGAGSSLVTGDPSFIVGYSYEGQESSGELTLKADEFVSSEPIPEGTVVTITEVKPVGNLVSGAGWGNPVLVLENGTVLANGSTITIEPDTVLNLVLENPTIPPLPVTGAMGLSAFVAWGAALLMLAGLGIYIVARRQRMSE
ncbi:DUF5979 domain-containing protein [Microbacterium sp. NPDC076911]|uniref:DUF5979 domain-containing protein n=1 Tax=Microbacterium sp. NPDC076911 TaxID=3154958 RepID=UPI00343C24E5